MPKRSPRKPDGDRPQSGGIDRALIKSMIATSVLPKLTERLVVTKVQSPPTT